MIHELWVMKSRKKQACPKKNTGMAGVNDTHLFDQLIQEMENPPPPPSKKLKLENRLTVLSSISTSQWPKLANAPRTEIGAEGN
jgi:hypothetical protein